MGKWAKNCAVFLSVSLMFGNISYAAEECMIWQGNDSIEMQLDEWGQIDRDINFLEETSPV